MLEVELSNRQTRIPIAADQLRSAVRAVLADHGVDQGSISLAVVDDRTMHELNRRYLNHDYPTDVLSFVLESTADEMDGQIVVSADMAERQAADYDWATEYELLLYVLHGALHLVGYDDHDEEKRKSMREQEDNYLVRFGAPQRKESNCPPDCSPPRGGSA
ncbi:MAG: rRNA maturation RNase YbeY [Pirellulaceae bacterium]|jgi:probable rRNA maturation factor|nr:rRNA maturation RNase YbeY [Pirellulaceae bacterium]